MMRILTRADVEAVLTLDDCIAAVEEVFRSYGQRHLAAPQSLGIHAESGTFHIKTAVVRLFAAKINANFPENPRRHGLPAIQGVIVLMDPDRGVPLAMLDSTLITVLRTAAATAVAAKHLSRQDAGTVTIIGCGAQGRAHLQALTRVRKISKAWAYDHDAEASERFAREMEERLTIEIRQSPSVGDAVAASDIVVSCTPARSPILDQRHLHPGLFIAGVGADNPDKNELAPELLARSLVVPDLLEQAETMGDLHHAIASGLLTRESIHGELADVISGRVPGRRSEDEIFVFDSTGTALQDAAAASVALARATQREIGLEVALT
jgi:ornithine cyclodeaminase/alanine dehydrogenase-like protein (mu-crystallin family)